MRGVVDYLESAKERYPARIAVLDENRQCTYQELWESAIGIAGAIRKMGIYGRPIVVASERNAHCLELFWGILCSGNAYVPLNYKADRRMFEEALKIVRPAAIFSCGFSDELVDAAGRIGAPYRSYLELRGADSAGSEADGCQDIDEVYPAHRVESDIAYIVFTSGTTGIPKGVAKSHRAIKAFIGSFTEIFSFSSNAVFGNQAEFDYDVAAKDIFLSAYLGATLAIIPRKCFLMPARLMGFLAAHRVSILIWAAAAIRLAARSGCLRSAECPPLEQVFFSGESLDVGDLTEWIGRFPGARFVNLYAPSEVMGNCMHYEADPAALPDRLPLGIPFPNTDILVLDDEGHEIAEGETGELYVRGDFIAAGYYGMPEETRERFMQNPLHDDYIDIVYRTGDFAKMEGGMLFFQGREDDQIKFMGHRIELSEIEHAFSELGMGESCCCFLKAQNEMVLFHTSELCADEIRGRLLGHLPKYKVPTLYERVEGFKANARGKVDKKRMMEDYERMIENGRESIGDIEGNPAGH